MVEKEWTEWVGLFQVGDDPYIRSLETGVFIFKEQHPLIVDRFVLPNSCGDVSKNVIELLEAAAVDVPRCKAPIGVVWDPTSTNIFPIYEIDGESVVSQKWAKAAGWIDGYAADLLCVIEGMHNMGMVHGQLSNSRVVVMSSGVRILSFGLQRHADADRFGRGDASAARTADMAFACDWWARLREMSGRRPPLLGRDPASAEQLVFNSVRGGAKSVDDVIAAMLAVCPARDLLDFVEWLGERRPSFFDRLPEVAELEREVAGLRAQLDERGDGALRLTLRQGAAPVTLSDSDGE